MEIFGIGALELVLILLFALILFGPRDMQKTGKALGSGLNRLVRSDTWQTLAQTWRKLRGLPAELMREANLDELNKDIGAGRLKSIKRDPYASWTSQPARPIKKESAEPSSPTQAPKSPKKKKTR